MVSYKQNLPVVFLGISYSFLVFLFCLFMFSCIGFIFHLSINSIYTVLSLMASLVSLFIFSKKNNFSIKYTIFTYILYVVIIVLAVAFGYKFYDSSWDGRAYHHAGIMLLSSGMNPIYDVASEYAQNIYNTKLGGITWVECYPKFVEIVWANIFHIFRNIEISKMTNILSSFIVFGYAFYVLNKEYFRKLGFGLTVIIPLLLVINPVNIAQIMTYYIDNYVYLFFLMLLFSVIDIETQENKNLLAYSIMIMSSVGLVSIKLGGLLYLILPVFMYLIYLALKKQMQKVKTVMLAFVIITLLSVVANVNPYITNLSRGRHIFYPLAGVDKVDIITHVTPTSFYGKPVVYTFLASNFSRVSNINFKSNKKHQLKLPFTMYKSELGASLGAVDTRICGFGVLWSGILLISCLLAFFIRYNSKEEKQLGLLIFSILLALLLVNPYNWWARYVHHFWALPIFTAMYLLLKNNISGFQKAMVYFLFFIMLSNVVIQSIFVLKREHRYHKNIIAQVSALKKYNKEIKIYYIYDWAFIEKLKENNIKFAVVTKGYFDEHKKQFRKIPKTLFDVMYWDY